MKKLMSLLVVFMLLAVSITGCTAAPTEDIPSVADNFTIIMQIDNPNMTVNDKRKEIDPGMGTVPIVINDRTLLPVRAVVEEIGGIVEWDDETQTVLLGYRNDVITLAIGNRTAYLNDTLKMLDTVPVVINGRTMLPIRFVAEGFGFTVEWEEQTQTVIITGEKKR